ncbi:MAG: ribonuclease D [Planctomycetota bacterium]
MPRRPSPTLIDKPERMRRFLAEIAGEERLAVDTEANSFHAYRQRVCLIQVSTRKKDFILDPLSSIDIDPFLEVLGDRRVLKVFHDAEFDLLLLGRQYDVRVAGLFDTKVAAVALGIEAVGLAALVESHFDVKLDKRYQRSDWGRRPLARDQLEYACRDTHYLLPLHTLLTREIEKAEPLIALECESECRRLMELDITPPEPNPDAWLRLKGARTLDPRPRRALHELHQWREREAEARDVPPFKVMSNASLLELARLRPRDRAELEQMQALSKSQLRRYGNALLGALEDARKKPGIVLERRRRVEMEDKELRSSFERLKKWRKERARRRQTDPSLILHREVLDALARLRPTRLEELAETGLLEAWRIEAYGEEILAALWEDRGEPE